MAEAKRLPVKHVVAVAAGNALAFYDFLAFAYFAVQIGHTFFPNNEASTFWSFVIFAVGFASRPLGAYFIGRIGDRIGRKPAMVLAITLMGLGVIGLALTPSYRSIGEPAPWIAAFFRAVLGFGLGGEVGPSTAYLLEAAPPEKRGFYASLQAMTQDVAAFISSLVGFGLALVLSDAQLDEWGWRVALGLGAVIVPFGLILRNSLPETLHAAEEVTPSAPAPVLQPYRVVAALGFVMLAAGTMISYTQTTLTAYASDTLRLATQVAFGAGMLNTFFTALFDPISGILSDKYGRKPVMIWGIIGTIVVTIPGFFAIMQFQGPMALYVTASLLGVVTGLAQPPVTVALCEALPRHLRSMGTGLVYATAITGFGALTPVVVTWLIHSLNDPLVPAWYMVAASAVGLVAMLLLKETAPRVLARRTVAA